MSELIDSNSLAYLRRQVSVDEVVLFTGAGFSAGCLSKSNQPLPTGNRRSSG
jgi:hypothetical protein